MVVVVGLIDELRVRIAYIVTARDCLGSIKPPVVISGDYCAIPYIYYFRVEA